MQFNRKAYNVNTEFPQYGTPPTQPGLYLGLFHGRLDPADAMDDWGFNGPLIGPLSFVHTTYTNHIKLDFENDCDAKRYLPQQTDYVLPVNEDMVFFKNRFYGDWTVFYVDESDCALPPDTFRDVPRSQHPLFCHQHAGGR